MMRFFFIVILMSFLPLVSSASNLCVGFYSKRVSLVKVDAQKVSDVMTEIPGLKKYVLEMIDDPNIPDSIKRVLKSSMQDHELDVSNLTDELRTLWNLNSGTAAFASFKGAGKTFTNSGNDESLNVTSFKNTTSLFDTNIEKKKTMFIAIPDAGAGTEQMRLIHYVHELAHIRMEWFLRKNWNRVAASLPPALAYQTADGAWVMHQHFKDLIHEKYAFETEYSVLKATQGKYFREWNKDWGDMPANLTKEELSRRIGAQLIDDYNLTDPIVMAMARLPLSKLLRGGDKRSHLISEMLDSYDVREMPQATLENMPLIMNFIRILRKANGKNIDRDVTAESFFNSIKQKKATISPERVEELSELTKHFLLFVQELPAARLHFVELLRSPINRKALNKLGWEFPNKVKLEWTDIVASHPKTKFLTDSTHFVKTPTILRPSNF